MIRIIISDELGQHGLDIKTAISNGYGSDISDQIQIISYWSPAFAEARDNDNIIALIRSEAGVSGYVYQALSIYPRVQTFFPLGSNTFEKLQQFNTPDPPVIIISGAGDYSNPTNDKNNTAYGNGLEFWDQDLNVSDTSDESSFSNGYVLGKILKIKDTLACTWWEARYRARINADRNESNRLLSYWDIYNGFGKINVDNAIAFTGHGALPEDPYYIVIPEPEPSLGAIGTITAINNNGKITGTIEAVENAEEYIVYKNDVELLRLGASVLSFVDVIETSESVISYTYKAIYGDQETAISAAASVYYPFKRIVGLRIETSTNKGTCAVQAVKEFRIDTVKELLKPLINVFIKDSDILRNVEAVKQLSTVSLAASEAFTNSLYLYLKTNHPDYENAGYVYEGEYFDMSTTAYKEVDDDYTLAVSDRSILITGDAAITLLDVAKIPGVIVNLVSDTDYEIAIASETEGQLIGEYASITLQRKGDAVQLQAVDNKYIILSRV